MSSSFSVENGDLGPRVTLHDSWSGEAASFLRSQTRCELELNYAKGFKGKDLSFLREFPQLTGVLLTHRTLDDDSPVLALPNLRRLHLHTYAKSPLDFGTLPALQELVLEWRTKVTGLFAHPALEKLFVNSYSGASLEKFGTIVRLRELSLANAKITSIGNLSGLSQLELLGLYNCKKLASCRGVEAVAGSLTRLEADGLLALTDIAPLAALKELECLHLNDNRSIASLEPIRNLSRLREVLFYGSTDIGSGDMSPLLALPALAKVSFQNRPHYSLTLQAVQRSLSGVVS